MKKSSLVKTVTSRLLSGSITFLAACGITAIVSAKTVTLRIVAYNIKDGDGQSNLQEFTAGTDPTNNASALQITSIVRSGSDIVVTWTMGSGKTNALQYSAGDISGNYSNNFADVFTVTNTVGTVTNYPDAGALPMPRPVTIAYVWCRNHLIYSGSKLMDV